MKKVFLLVILISALICSDSYSKTFRNAVFLHHSTGGCIWGPNGSATSVPDEVNKYNKSKGLIGSEIVKFSEKPWPETPWDNEWYRWDNIFAKNDKDADIYPIINNYDIIVIKSCYPSSELSSWGSPSDTNTFTKKTIYNYKWHWKRFIQKMSLMPEKFFVIWTNAPLTESTSEKAGALSNAFCKWAKDTLAKGLDKDFPNFPKNVYIFDYFHKLANAKGLLPLSLSASAGDSHPNGKATEIVAPLFVQEVFDNALKYENVSKVENESNSQLNAFPTLGSDKLKLVFKNSFSELCKIELYAYSGLLIHTEYIDSDLLNSGYEISVNELGVCSQPIFIKLTINENQFFTKCILH